MTCLWLLSYYQILITTSVSTWRAYEYKNQSKLKFFVYALVMFVLKVVAFLVSFSSAEELMKDINSMLSDFSSELDSMFD